jgi:hypothetical protein
MKHFKVCFGCGCKELIKAVCAASAKYKAQLMAPLLGYGDVLSVEEM